MKLDPTKYDRIVVRQVTMEKIRTWRDSFSPVEKISFDDSEMPMLEGILDIGDLGPVKLNLIYFNINHPDGIFISLHVDGINIIDFNYKDGEYTVVESPIPTNGRRADNDQALMKFCMGNIAYVMSYILYFQSEKVYVTERTERVARTKKPKGGKGKNRVVYITKKIYQLNDVPGDIPHRTYERRSEAWSVRRHPRTYKKTGKTIWIESFWKGDPEKRPDAPTTFKL